MTTHTESKAILPDKDGYYRVTLGAFNVLNHSGAAYSFKGVKEFLADKSTVFNRRMTAGRLRAEADHPKREPGMTDEQFILRNLDIPMANACAHIKEIIIKETNSSENIPGLGNIVLVEGLIRPSGPKSDGLRESLENPHEDTCFSIRSFTRDMVMNGIVVKFIKQIVTWDWVNEPGIKYASKLGKPSVESYDIASLDISDLARLSTTGFMHGCSLESQDQTNMVQELLQLCSSTDIVDRW